MTKMLNADPRHQCDVVNHKNGNCLTDNMCEAFLLRPEDHHQRYLIGGRPIEPMKAPGWESFTGWKERLGLLAADMQPFRYTFNAESQGQLGIALWCHKPLPIMSSIL